MKLVNVECLLMDNAELMFNGRSLGFTGKKGKVIKGAKLIRDDDEFITVLRDYNIDNV